LGKEQILGECENVQRPLRRKELRRVGAGRNRENSLTDREAKKETARKSGW
jgi:hypothetical protein